VSHYPELDDADLEKRILDGDDSVSLAVGQVFSPEHITTYFSGAIQYKGVPPVNVVAAMQLNGLDQIGFGWMMDCPSAEIPDYFLSSFARDPSFRVAAA
jgi:hypothetical protein